MQATVTWSGAIDYRGQEKLRREAEAAVRGLDVDELVIDIAAVTFIDSMGVSVLLDARHAAENVGVRVVLRGASDNIRDVLQLTGVYNLFGTA